jgi:hypothetical protein
MVWLVVFITHLNPNKTHTELVLVLCPSFFLSRRTGLYSVQSRPKDASGKPPYHCCNSRDSLDQLFMDEYWTEVENITLSGEGKGDAEPQEVVQLKLPDGMELYTIAGVSIEVEMRCVCYRGRTICPAASK